MGSDDEKGDDIVALVPRGATHHPSLSDAGWRPVSAIPSIDTVAHIPLGDLAATLRIVGLEVRIQVRDING